MPQIPTAAKAAIVAFLLVISGTCMGVLATLRILPMCGTSQKEKKYQPKSPSIPKSSVLIAIWSIAPRTLEISTQPKLHYLELLSRQELPLARLGRRLTIGGSGVGLSDDDSLSQTGSRGEVRRYVPPSEDVQAAEAARIGAGATHDENAPDTSSTTPIIIMPEGGGSDAAAAAAAPAGETATNPGSSSSGVPGAADNSPSDTGTPGGGDVGEFAGGGPVGGAGREHPISAQNGEWIINKGAVAKYGDNFMSMLNAGKIPVTTAKAYAKGGKVGGGNWIAGAIKHPGALTRQAHAAGQSPMAFAAAHKGDSGTTGRRARLALTLRGLARK